ncbi:sodium-dependent bicarbonate transport family permease [Nibricoccus aquaticus]|uniref:Sodium-dependent bicarbonate transport family permease n=1 Tax=Nibricoccus aquaticus TaxID=2576891 RepID=A0A290QKI2_9BACT|nr:sodium-dependent bicarbonate transport family permease [Nibricoccus aquaticus]ATC64372.1 sodium-dependent bicarbonate transport family permease [Nibricoccus aquaticus]
MLENLLDPLFLFFVVGFAGGVLRSDLKLPDAVYQLLSTYLLLAIGLKGGVQLAQVSAGEIVMPALATLGLGLFVPVVVFAVAMRIGKLGRADAASLAAHYGSASAVTFAAGLEMVRRAQMQHEGFLPVLLVLLEIPAILVAIFLHRSGAKAASVASESGKAGESYGAIVHEILLNRSVFLLLAGMAVGFLSGPGRFASFEPLFVHAFKPILAFFILEMGLVAAQRMPEIKKAGVFLVTFGIVCPLIVGALGGWLGLLSGLSQGGAVILATMAASASYIAAPAAIRVAIPEANTGLSIAAALGVTFPFNLALGIPLYMWWVGRIG